MAVFAAVCVDVAWSVLQSAVLERDFVAARYR